MSPETVKTSPCCASCGESSAGRHSCCQAAADKDSSWQLARCSGDRHGQSACLKLKRGAPLPAGLEAAERLRAVVGGDPVRCQVQATDQYKRSVAVCSTPKVQLNQWMVDQGQAVAYRCAAPLQAEMVQPLPVTALGLLSSSGASRNAASSREPSLSKITVEVIHNGRRPCCSLERHCASAVYTIMTQRHYRSYISLLAVRSPAPRSASTLYLAVGT